MTFRASVEKVYRETRGINPIAFILCLLVQLSMQSLKTHSKAFFILKILQYCKQEIAKFYLAEILYFYGDFHNALTHLDSFLSVYPNHADAIYLKCQILIFCNQKQKAFSLLEKLLQTSNRLKTWGMFREAAQDIKDIQRLQSLYQNNLNRVAKFQNSKIEILKYLAQTALNVQEYNNAKRLIQESLWDFLRTNQARTITKKSMRSQDAKEALEDLEVILSANHIQMFLISGTFLGCVREGKLISYDNDIDVGVWHIELDKLREIFICSKAFKLKNLNYTGGVQLYHLNGVYLDVFIHYEHKNKIYHNGDYVCWWNSKFELKEYEFLGRTYQGPSDYERYLSENYGKDWRTPKNHKDYHTYLSTPNMEILGKDRFIFVLYTMLFERFSIHHESQILNKLQEFGEGQFVQEYLDFKQGKAQ